MKTLVFVDSQVADIATLMSSLDPAAEVVVLDPHRDGLAQMADAAATRDGLDSIQVFSHGAPGQLTLGSTVVNGNALPARADQLASLGQALRPGGDLLLFGCSVALGDSGQRFIEALARLTGADVAASTDPTGAAALGGDWIFEAATGSIEAAPTLVADADVRCVLGENRNPSFESGPGMVVTAIDLLAQPNSMVIQADGKVIVAGGSQSINSSIVGAPAVVRYNNDGSLDASFGGDGTVITDLGPGMGTAQSVTLQPDGKILVTGWLGNSISSKFVLVRYNADGSLDTTFDGDGKVVTDLGLQHAYGESVTLQADGRILVAGRGRLSGGSESIVVARFNSNGSLDTTFDSDGKVIAPIQTTDSNPNVTIAVQPDGKILVSGTGQDNSRGRTVCALARLNSDGSWDANFGIDGIVTTDIGSQYSVSSAMLQPNGTILVAGDGYDGGTPVVRIARYTADGILDTSFGRAGIATVETVCQGGTAYANPEGMIVVAGYDNDGRTKLARLFSDGSQDTDFGRASEFPGWTSSLSNIALDSDPNGKIFVSGCRSPDDGVFFLGRLNGDGSVDGAFGQSPWASTLGNTVAYSEQGPAAILADSVQAYDPELAATDHYAGAVLTVLRHGGANADDFFGAGGNLQFVNGLAILAGNPVATLSVAPGTLTLNFFAASQAQVNGVLRQVTYRNTSDAPPASVQIDWAFNDGNTGAQGSGGALTTTGSTTVAIAATNDAPVISVPGTQLPIADTDHVVRGVNVTDPDSGTLRVTLLVNHGVVSLAGTMGLTFQLGDGTADATMIFSGAQAALNAALGGLVYRGNAGYIGADTITLSTTDLGGSGAGGALSDTHIIAVTVRPANTPHTGTVARSGLAREGQTLSVLDTLADADGLGARTYTWQSSSDGTAWADIGTGTSVALGAAQLGQTIRVTAAYLDGLGYAESAVSAASTPVLSANHPPGGLLAVAGLPVPGQTLAVIDALADADGLGPRTYTWQASSDGSTWGSIGTGSTLLLGIDQLGRQVRVRADYVDGAGNAETIASAPTGFVASFAVSLNNPHTGSLAIAGSPAVGGTLTVMDSLADVDGLGPRTYGWQASGDGATWTDIGTGASLALAAGQVGLGIRVLATYTDGQGHPEVALSTATPAVAAAPLNLVGTVGRDTLVGGTGDDSLDGGAGADLLVGGKGNDTYVLGSTRDVVRESAGEGNDTVLTPYSYTLVWTQIENVTLTGAAARYATGNAADNVLTGNGAANALDGGLGNDSLFGNGGNDVLVGGRGNDLLDGGTGNDALRGGAGDDAYVVDSVGDTVTELAGEGSDRVTSSVSWTLGANLENLALTGSANINATGNALDNLIRGNDGNNVLNGGGGVDDLAGGAGDDSYVADNVDDSVRELADEGNDTLVIAYNNAGEDPVAVGLPEHFENLTAQGTGLYDLIGTDVGNVLTGNAAINALFGFAGNDTLIGGAGNDFLDGGDGNDLLDGGAGSDELVGGDGDDRYILDAPADTVFEEGGDPARGNDTIVVAFSASLLDAKWDNIENMALSGTAANATGDAGANRLEGNASANLLDGKEGADTMVGGLGADTYVVDDAGDVVTEASALASEIDTVKASVSYTLGANLENLTLTGMANLMGTGNDLKNTIMGNDGDNVLDGGLGADTLKGGKGNDSYRVDLAKAGTLAVLQDSIAENVNEGTDTLQLRTAGDLGLATATTLILAANLENYDASDTGANKLNLTGNAANNVLTGNDADNVLNGGAGNDTLVGGAGNDRFLTGGGNDSFTGGAGGDTFIVERVAALVAAIGDFEAGSDKLGLGQTAYGALFAAGALKAGVFANGTAATTAAQRLFYDGGTGGLWYDSDGTGATAAVRIATLANAPVSLAASDFVLAVGS